MEQKIQLKHPAGKQAVRIDKTKYEVLSKSIFRVLKNKTLTHKELLEAIIQDFKKHKIKFDGSIEWYMESVKLDLEANKILCRIKDKTQPKFKLACNKLY